MAKSSREGLGREARRAGSALILAVLVLAGIPSFAQEEEEDPESAAVSRPAGVATLVLDGRQSPVPFTLGARGPLFALRPVASRLVADLRVGPLGDSHTLVFENKEINVGPGAAQMVVTADGEPQIVPLSQTPIKTVAGLEVPLDFLERALGDELGFELVWRPLDLRLEVTRRQLREVEASITLVNHGRVTTIEVAFSTKPRYRVERSPGAVEVRLVGDRLREPVRRTLEQDPLVRNVLVAPSRLRFELAEDASAAEPRWLASPPRLILEVFRQAPRTAGEAVSTEDAPWGTPPARSDDGIRTIVIDPGHGGGETGAVGPSGVQEKELTLVIARTLKRQLERRLPVQVVLTREEDAELPLDARAAIANQNKGDLFISLHLNAYYGPRAHGAETYFLSREASDQRAAESAAAENLSAVDDPESGLQLILWDLAQSYHLQESQRFANLVQEELNLALGLRDRGVKQAPFRVLMGAAMPAVLVELGFVSNPDEEAKLQTVSYRDELVDALVRAIVRLRSQLEARSGAASEESP